VCEHSPLAEQVGAKVLFLLLKAKEVKYKRFPRTNHHTHTQRMRCSYYYYNPIYFHIARHWHVVCMHACDVLDVM
jgi:hypothetical protein